MIKESTRHALDIWLSNYPESYHPLDMDRFYSLIKKAYENCDLGELVSLELVPIVKEVKPTWSDGFVRQFCDEWERKISLCKGLMEFIYKPSL